MRLLMHPLRAEGLVFRGFQPTLFLETAFELPRSLRCVFLVTAT